MHEPPEAITSTLRLLTHRKITPAKPNGTPGKWGPRQRAALFRRLQEGVSRHLPYCPSERFPRRFNFLIAPLNYLLILSDCSGPRMVRASSQYAYGMRKSSATRTSRRPISSHVTGLRARRNAPFGWNSENTLHQLRSNGKGNLFSLSPRELRRVLISYFSISLPRWEL
jgi:hypothetical protein